MSALLLVCGEGGHYAQMMRLVKHVGIDASGFDLIVLSDSPRCVVLGTSPLVVQPVRNKEKTSFVGKLMTTLHGVSAQLGICFNLVLRKKVRVMLSTGPGLAILPALFIRMMGGTVIHVETWSRFSTRSLTGIFMYWLSSRFYVQNKELGNLYRKAIYAGRL